MSVEIIDSDPLRFPVEILVSPWSAGPVPWWLRPLTGVAAQVRRRAGGEVYRELAEEGRMRPGEARLTGPGRLGIKGIIHVAVADAWGRGAAQAVPRGIVDALTIVHQLGFRSVLFPALGASVLGDKAAFSLVYGTLEAIETPVRIFVVRAR